MALEAQLLSIICEANAINQSKDRVGFLGGFMKFFRDRNMAAAAVLIVFGGFVVAPAQAKPLPTMHVSAAHTYVADSGAGFTLDLTNAANFLTSQYSPKGAIRFAPVAGSGLEISLQPRRGSRPTFKCTIMGDNGSPAALELELRLPGRGPQKQSIPSLQGTQEITMRADDLQDGTGRSSFVIRSTNSMPWRFSDCTITQARS